MKNIEYECPECGEFEEVYNVSDPELDVTADQMGHTYEIISIERRCDRCGHHWIEYMRLVYDGCCSKSILYDKDGQIDKGAEV